MAIFKIFRFNKLKSLFTNLYQHVNFFIGLFIFLLIVTYLINKYVLLHTKPIHIFFINHDLVQAYVTSLIAVNISQLGIVIPVVILLVEITTRDAPTLLVPLLRRIHVIEVASYSIFGIVINLIFNFVFTLGWESVDLNVVPFILFGITAYQFVQLVFLGKLIRQIINDLKQDAIISLLDEILISRLEDLTQEKKSSDNSSQNKDNTIKTSEAYSDAFSIITEKCVQFINTSQHTRFATYLATHKKLTTAIFDNKNASILSERGFFQFSSWYDALIPILVSLDTIGEHIAKRNSEEFTRKFFGIFQAILEVLLYSSGFREVNGIYTEFRNLIFNIANSTEIAVVSNNRFFINKVISTLYDHRSNATWLKLYARNSQNDNLDILIQNFKEFKGVCIRALWRIARIAAKYKDRSLFIEIVAALNPNLVVEDLKELSTDENETIPTDIPDDEIKIIKLKERQKSLDDYKHNLERHYINRCFWFGGYFLSLIIDDHLHEAKRYYGFWLEVNNAFELNNLLNQSGIQFSKTYYSVLFEAYSGNYLGEEVLFFDRPQATRNLTKGFLDKVFLFFSLRSVVIFANNHYWSEDYRVESKRWQEFFAFIANLKIAANSLKRHSESYIGLTGISVEEFEFGLSTYQLYLDKILSDQKSHVIDDLRKNSVQEKISEIDTYIKTNHLNKLRNLRLHFLYSDKGEENTLSKIQFSFSFRVVRQHLILAPYPSSKFASSALRDFYKMEDVQLLKMFYEVGKVAKAKSSWNKLIEFLIHLEKVMEKDGYRPTIFILPTKAQELFRRTSHSDLKGAFSANIHTRKYSYKNFPVYFEDFIDNQEGYYILAIDTTKLGSIVIPEIGSIEVNEIEHPDGLKDEVEFIISREIYINNLNKDAIRKIKIDFTKITPSIEIE